MDGDDLDIDWLECPKCGARYITPRQLRAHQSKHSDYFEDNE